MRFLLILSLLPLSAFSMYDFDKCEKYMMGEPEVEQMVKDEFKKYTNEDILQDEINGAGYSLFCEKDFDNSKVGMIYMSEQESKRVEK